MRMNESEREQGVPTRESKANAKAGRQRTHARTSSHKGQGEEEGEEKVGGGVNNVYMPRPVIVTNPFPSYRVGNRILSVNFAR